MLLAGLIPLRTMPSIRNRSQGCIYYRPARGPGSICLAILFYILNYRTCLDEGIENLRCHRGRIEIGVS